MKAKLELTGLDDYLEALQKADKDINPIARSVLAEVGTILQAAMRSRVNDKDIQDHIRIRTPSREGDYNYVEVGVLYGLQYTDKETFIKAIVIEFGSVNNAAHPYVRPAIRANRTAITNLIHERLKAAELVD